MKVLEFKYLSNKDDSDPVYFDGACWSRPYEYHAVSEWMSSILEEGAKVHNTSWGFDTCHIQFKNKLEETYDCLHSDIRASKLPNTCVYDITKPPVDEWVGQYDAVVNISTVEEVRFDHVMIIQNLLSMVKEGGYLVITFDLPGLQLQRVEEMVGQKIKDCESRLSGASSEYPNRKYTHLNCGILVIQR